MALCFALREDSAFVQPAQTELLGLIEADWQVPLQTAFGMEWLGTVPYFALLDKIFLMAFVPLAQMELLGLTRVVYAQQLVLQQ
jgi:hypothetical protein